MLSWVARAWPEPGCVLLWPRITNEMRIVFFVSIDIPYGKSSLDWTMQRPGINHCHGSRSSHPPFTSAYRSLVSRKGYAKDTTAHQDSELEDRRGTRKANQRDTLAESMLNGVSIMLLAQVVERRASHAGFAGSVFIDSSVGFSIEFRAC